jgi:2-amino-4-hydroxy-6-hydroxymethyldihydropteridine diphosphokinase
MHKVVIAIGSNIDAEENIPAAINLLAEKAVIIKQASMLKTAPIGITNQPVFTNSAVLVETHLPQSELNQLLKQIENQLGRDRTAPKFGPRKIDLDILMFNDEIVDPDYFSRDFLRQLASELISL